jgi:hypothetical protein
MIPAERSLEEYRKEGPLTVVGFVQTYLVRTTIIGNAVLQLGHWQAFLPNLATSLVVLGCLTYANPGFCASGCSATDADLELLSIVPKSLDVLSGVFYPLGVFPVRASDAPHRCTTNISALQVRPPLPRASH